MLFHDGHELTAADVVYTFSSSIDPSFISARKGAYRLLDKVTALDRYAVRFSLKEPFGSFPIQLVMPVVPNGAGADLRDHPVGTGPYKFVRFAVDDRLELAAFPQYFRGAPANDGVVLKVVPDEIMRALELRKGTVDLVVNDRSPDVVHQLAADAWAFEPNVFQFTHDVARVRALLDEAGSPDPDMLRRVFPSKQMPPSGFNRGYYENAEVDRLIDAATAAASDADRRRLISEAQRVVAEDAPYISLWTNTNVAVSRTGIEGVKLTPSAEFTFLRAVTKR